MAAPFILRCLYSCPDQHLDPEFLGYSGSQMDNQHPFAHPAIFDSFFLVHHVPAGDISTWMDGIGWGVYIIVPSESAIMDEKGWMGKFFESKSERN